MDARDRQMKFLKMIIVVLGVCFFIGPFIFWKNVSQFNSTGLTIYLSLHLIAFGSLFLFFLYQYKKVSKGGGK
jgi:hypothetical protein